MIQTAVWGVPVLKGSSVDTLMAINSGDRAVLEEEDERMAAAGKEMGRNGKERGARRRRRGTVKLRLVRGLGASTPGDSERARGGWYLYTSRDAPGGSQSP